MSEETSDTQKKRFYFDMFLDRNIMLKASVAQKNDDIYHLFYNFVIHNNNVRMRIQKKNKCYYVDMNKKILNNTKVYIHVENVKQFIELLEIDYDAIYEDIKKNRRTRLTQEQESKLRRRITMEDLVRRRMTFEETVSRRTTLEDCSRRRITLEDPLRRRTIEARDISEIRDSLGDIEYAKCIVYNSLDSRYSDDEGYIDLSTLMYNVFPKGSIFTKYMMSPLLPLKEPNEFDMEIDVPEIPKSNDRIITTEMYVNAWKKFILRYK